MPPGWNAGVAERRVPPVPTQLVAAVVRLGLLGEALLEEPLQRLEVEVVEQRRQGPPLLVGQARQGERVGEPVPDLVGDLDRRLDALEAGRERLVVLVVERLGLDEDAARQRVERSRLESARPSDRARMSIIHSVTVTGTP